MKETSARSSSRSSASRRPCADQPRGTSFPLVTSRIFGTLRACASHASASLRRVDLHSNETARCTSRTSFSQALGTPSVPRDFDALFAGDCFGTMETLERLDRSLISGNRPAVAKVTPATYTYEAPAPRGCQLLDFYCFEQHVTTARSKRTSACRPVVRGPGVLPLESARALRSRRDHPVPAVGDRVRLRTRVRSRARTQRA